MNTNLTIIQFIVVSYWTLFTTNQYWEYSRLLNMGVRPRYAFQLAKQV